MTKAKSSTGELDEGEGEFTLTIRFTTLVPQGTADRAVCYRLEQRLLDALDSSNLGHHEIVELEAAVYVPEPEPK